MSKTTKSIAEAPPERDAGKAGVPEVVRQFAIAVRRRRREIEMSQETLADLAEVHRNFIGRLERQETSVGLDAADRIAKALGLALKDML